MQGGSCIMSSVCCSAVLSVACCLQCYNGSVDVSRSTMPALFLVDLGIM